MTKLRKSVFIRLNLIAFFNMRIIEMEIISFTLRAIAFAPPSFFYFIVVMCNRFRKHTQDEKGRKKHREAGHSQLHTGCLLVLCPSFATPSPTNDAGIWLWGPGIFALPFLQLARRAGVLNLDTLHDSPRQFLWRGVNVRILNNASQEGPHLVRLKKACLRRRINGQLTLRYEAGGLTSFAGLELVGRFVRRLDFRVTLRRVARALPKSDFGAVQLSMLVLATLIAGARRVRHVCYLAKDPLAERLRGLSRLPSWHTLGRWLRGFDDGGVNALLEVNERLVAEVIDNSGLPRLTLDLDGSVVSTGFRVEGARRGFNPHRRKVPSYYPITAYEANTGQVLSPDNS